MPRKLPRQWKPTEIIDGRDLTPMELDKADWNPVRNKGYKGKQRHKGINSLKGAPFIAWDGEGTAVEKPEVMEMWGDRTVKGKIAAQPYVLLAYHTGTTGDAIQSEYGLSTKRCLDFLLETKQRYMRSIFVGYGLGYDINQILCDLPPGRLREIWEGHKTIWQGYYLEWIPGKWLTVVRGGRNSKRRSATIYDVSSFFAQPFIETCREYLGEDDPDLPLIEAGKEHRSEFNWNELEDFIIPYNNAELRMLVRIMNQLRSDLSSIGIHPAKWYGPGAVADAVFTKHKVKVSRDIPPEVVDASQYAYAGGRFEQFYMGRYSGTVYEYDIHSAYPAEAAGLPDLSQGYWEHAERYEPGSFGIWRVEYRDEQYADAGSQYRPQPLFCRSYDGSISYPQQVHGWYWTPEADLVPDSVREGYVFRATSSARPFAFVEGYYEQRQLLKDQKNPAQRAVKIILASLYGKNVQTVGGKGGPPKWHQLEWGGWITSAVRAKIYRAIMLDPDNIIAAETDAVFSKVPLNLTLSDSLGDWEPKEHDGIVYLQSGFYYAGPVVDRITKDCKTVCKFRGMDRDRATGFPVGLPYREVLDHLAFRPTSVRARTYTPSLHCSSTRFVGLAAGLETQSTWRSWETIPRRLSLDGSPWYSKRYHLREECPACARIVAAGGTLADELHPLQIGGHSGKSYARRLPWIEHPLDAPVYDWEEWQDAYDKNLERLEMEQWDG